MAPGSLDSLDELHAALLEDLRESFRQQREWLDERLMSAAAKPTRGGAAAMSPGVGPIKTSSSTSERQGACRRVQALSSSEREGACQRADLHGAVNGKTPLSCKGAKTPQGLGKGFTESQIFKMEVAATQSEAAPMYQGSEQSGSGCELLRKLVYATCFETTCSVLILTNAISIGVEAQYMSARPLQPTPQAFEVLSLSYTVLFALELLVRLLADIKGFYRSNQWLWNLVDVTIVTISVIELGMRTADVGGSKNLTFIRIIRMARIVRIFRIVRLLKVFTPLRILVYSVLSTLRSLGWTLLLLMILIYLFAVLFTQAVTENEQVSGHDEELARYYGSLFQTVSTLFKSITGGVSWEEVSSPLWRVHAVWELIFFVFVAFMFFAVFNVVTGVFCQSAIENANYDKDVVVAAQLSQKQVYTERLQELFRSMDSTKSGRITLSRLEDSLQSDQVMAYFHSLEITATDAWNLFKLLADDDGSGINLESFVTGCLRLRGSARSVDIHMLMYESRWMRKRISDLTKSFNSFLESFPEVVEEAAGAGAGEPPEAQCEFPPASEAGAGSGGRRRCL